MRPASHSTSRLAASEMASPTASGAMPSARAAAAASAAWAGVARVDRQRQPIDPGVLGLAVSRLLAEQFVLLQQLRQHGSDALVFVVLDADAEPNRLAEQGQGILLADQVESRPGTPGQHHAMDVDLVVNAVLQVVVGIVERALRQGGKGGLGRADIALAEGFAQQLAAGTVFRQSGRHDGMERFLLAAASCLHAAGVAMQHLEDRQDAAGLGQLPRHVQGRQQGR